MTLWQNTLIQPTLLLSSIYTKRSNKRHDKNLRDKLLEAKPRSQRSIFCLFPLPFTDRFPIMTEGTELDKP